MARLAIRKVKYAGEKYYYNSPDLDDGLNIIEGPNGTGKSTLIKLIYYCLGGKVGEFNREKTSRHLEITSDENNRVELLIQIDDLSYSLVRYIGTNDITVHQEGEDIQVYPITRTVDNKFIFSDWMLEKLNIKVLDVYQGKSSWKINLMDLFRLVYYDQETKPKNIFKSSDFGNFTDNKQTRKAIFEILMGNSFKDYYSSFSDLKDTESEQSKLKGAVDLYKKIIQEVQNMPEDLNLVFLKKQVQDKALQINKLERYRGSLRKVQKNSDNSFSSINSLKDKLFDKELRQSDIRLKLKDSYEELSKFENLKESLIVEVTQIKKMIYSHEQLNLFSADTCPYCLTNIKREKNKCVCGTKIDEAKYERFFYTSSEYLDILKSKQKSVETIDIAISSSKNNITSMKDELKKLDVDIQKCKEEIKDCIEDIDENIDLNKIEEVTNQIIKIKTEISDLKQQIQIEEKRQNLEDKLRSSDAKYKRIKNKTSELHAKAQTEMEDQIEKFNNKYNSLMIDAVSDCRRASIDEFYMPIINDGEYKESSAEVPKRLLYFWTLLYLSLQDKEISFPRFLLVDTPETLGIDKGDLLSLIGKIDEITDDEKGVQDFQIILTTGVEKYPDKYKKFVKEVLTDENRLLKLKDSVGI